MHDTPHPGLAGGGIYFNKRHKLDYILQVIGHNKHGEI